MKFHQILMWLFTVTIVTFSTAFRIMPDENLMGVDLFSRLLAPEEDEMESETELGCDGRLFLIFEIYNTNYSILTKIRDSIDNVIIWDGDSSFVSLDENFEETEESSKFLNTFDQNFTKPTTNITQPESLLVGVLPNEAQSLLLLLTNMRVTFKDMEYHLCLAILGDEPTLEDYDIQMSNEENYEEVNTSNKFTIPSHMTSAMYPKIFYNILISPADESSAILSPIMNPSLLPQTNSLSPPFSDYISHDENSGLIKLKHGTIPIDGQSRWAWVPSKSKSDEFSLVNELQPNQKVAMNADGNLMVSPKDNGGDLNKTELLFTLHLGPQDFMILAELNNETYCLVPYFATTLRLILVSNEEMKVQCTRFKLLLGEVTVTTEMYNTTFIDLYTTQTMEWMDMISERFTEETSDSTVILYFTSPPTALEMFVRGTSATTPMQELHQISNDYLANDTICVDNYLQTEYEMKPVLTCKLGHDREEMDSQASSIEMLDPSTNPNQKARQRIGHQTKIQMFQNYIKFQFRTKGLTPCEEKPLLLCATQVGMSDLAVKALLGQVGIDSSKLVRGGETEGDDGTNLVYWREGVITFMNSKLLPSLGNERILNKNKEKIV